MYSHFSPPVRGISTSAWYLHQCVVSPPVRGISTSAWYLHQCVVSPPVRGISTSAWYLHQCATITNLRGDKGVKIKAIALTTRIRNRTVINRCKAESNRRIDQYRLKWDLPWYCEDIVRIFAKAKTTFVIVVKSVGLYWPESNRLIC